MPMLILSVVFRKGALHIYLPNYTYTNNIFVPKHDLQSWHFHYKLFFVVGMALITFWKRALHICTCTCIVMYEEEYRYVYLYQCRYISTYKYMYIHVYICRNMNLYIYISMWIYKNVHIKNIYI